MKEALMAALKAMTPAIMAALGAVTGSVYFAGPGETSSAITDNAASAELCRVYGYTPVYRQVDNSVFCDVSQPLAVKGLKADQYLMICTKSKDPDFPDDCTEQ